VQRLKVGQSRWVGFYLVFPENIIGVVLPGSPADRAGLHVGDRLEAVNGVAVATLTGQVYTALRNFPLTLAITPVEGGDLRSIQLEAVSFEPRRLPHGRRLAHDVGYLELPELLNAEVHGNAYTAEAHTVIRGLDQTPIRGWVVDLRGNTGGAFWPMLAGVGPIAGEGELVGFIGPTEKLIGVYHHGLAEIEGQERFRSQVEEPYTLKQPWLPVAVLTSQLTGSAGEFVLLAFRGRPRTRSFGSPTAGVPTGNDFLELSDGAQIALTQYLGMDRTGRTYDSALPPDQPVRIDWRRYGADDDPVLQAAVEWLHTEIGAP
jgi:carboxyl-terminal processing protease